MAGRILIVDDVATNRIVLKVKLMAACYEVLQASGGADAIASARIDQPDLILLDQMMPDMDGIAVCKKLKEDPETARIPVIIITADNDNTSKINALRAGADECMSKPLDELCLLARVRSLLRARDMSEELRLRDSTARELGFAETPASFTPSATIAMIAATPVTAMAWKTALGNTLHDKVVVIKKEQALSLTKTQNIPDVFVIACNLAKPDEGLRLMSELRSRPETRYSAVVMVIPKDANNKSATALDLGASDLMIEGFEPQEMALRIKTQIRRKIQADRLRETVRDGLRMAVIDPLTGLYNRRYAMPHLARIADHAKTSGRTYAVMVLDIDRFKAINDTHGHTIGDIVLQEVATRIKDNLRSVDMVARIGGEEFLVVMPDTHLDEARMAAERLCHVIDDRPVILAGDKGNIAVSLSIGVAMGGLHVDVRDVGQLLESADKALYCAKSDGRNQVTFSRTAA
ncbi:diguanylate cyclase [Profundibacter sp.]